MAPKLDSAILEALSLDPAKTIIASHGGSGFASTAKITSEDADGNERLFFVKTGMGKDAEIMFAGEHASLNAIHNIVPSLCPKSYAHGPLTDTKGTSFLATDFLTLSPSTITSSPTTTKPTTYQNISPKLSLAKKLAILHSTPAPIPPGYEKPQFGFPVPTCCGSTEQENSYKSSWSDFYASNRLLPVFRAAENHNGKDAELSTLLKRIIDIVVPRLIGEGHLKSWNAETAEWGDVIPVVVHGDLWSGNHGSGVFSSYDGKGEVEEVVFDPSSCYAHAEFEFGIMRMFGGFGTGFWREYYEEERREKDRPVGEWRDRVELYELYHHLNHYALFGRGYKGGAVGIMKRLLDKYG